MCLLTQNLPMANCIFRLTNRKNPNVTLLLKAEWFHLEVFSRFKKKVPIYWLYTRALSPLYVPKSQIDLTKRSPSYFVVEQAITAAMYMGVKQIYMLGYEGNGIAHLLTNNDTHF